MYSNTYSDGSQFVCEQYTNGVPDGLALYYSPDGKVLSECEYLRGVPLKR
jgi:antitoxin component YwqK of YwqJK toxin-antitoxin module